MLFVNVGPCCGVSPVILVAETKKGGSKAAFLYLRCCRNELFYRYADFPPRRTKLENDNSAEEKRKSAPGTGTAET